MDSGVFPAGQLALKHICILGSTGSIGTSTLSIIEHYPERFAVASLAAGTNVDLAFASMPALAPAGGFDGHGSFGERLGLLGLRRQTSAASKWSMAPREQSMRLLYPGWTSWSRRSSAWQDSKRPMPLWPQANRSAWPQRGPWSPPERSLPAGAPRRRAPVAYRLRAQCHPPVPAWRSRTGSPPHLVDRFGRPLSPASAGSVPARHRGAGATPSHLDHGAPGDHRFRHHAQ